MGFYGQVSQFQARARHAKGKGAQALFFHNLGPLHDEHRLKKRRSAGCSQIRGQTWYRANWRLGTHWGSAEETRFPFGDVVMARLDERGDLVIDTIAADYEALVAERVAQGLIEPVPEGALARSAEVRIAPDSAAAACDPLALLIDKSCRPNDGRRGIRGGDKPFYRTKFPLFPQERWTATGAMRLGDADIEASREMEQRMRAAFDEWFAGQPQLHGDALTGHGAVMHFWRIGDVAFCANLQLFTDEPALKDELVQLLLESGSGIEHYEEQYPGHGSQEASSDPPPAETGGR